MINPNYLNIATVNKNASYQYLYKDAKVNFTSIFYRLKMVDKDGKFSYSSIVAVRLDKENVFVFVYPNPVTNGVLYINTTANLEKNVAIFDVLGKQVLNTTATESVNVSNLKGGVYIVKITEEGKTATRKLVIK